MFSTSFLVNVKLKAQPNTVRQKEETKAIEIGKGEIKLFPDDMLVPVGKYPRIRKHLRKS